MSYNIYIFFHQTMNIVLLGDCQTGKTSYAKKLTEDQFSDSYAATIAKELFVVVYEDQVVYIHDCSGLDRYQDLNQMYYEKASGFIVFFTNNDPQKWIDKIPKGKPYIKVLNKCDIYKSNNDIQISCKKNINIQKPLSILYPLMEKPAPYTWYSFVEYLLSFINF